MSLVGQGTLAEIMAGMVYTEQTYLAPQFPGLTSSVDEPNNLSSLQGITVFRLPPSMKPTLWSAGGAGQGAQHRIVWQFDIVYVVAGRNNNKLGSLMQTAGSLALPAYFAYLTNPNLKTSANGVGTVNVIKFPEPHFTMGEFEFSGVKQFCLLVRMDCHQLIRQPT